MQVSKRIPAEAVIEKFSHDGRGIARINGKTTFIQGALPGETILFQYTKIKSDFDEGVAIDVIDASKLRAAPPCLHYAECGGCSLQHLNQEAQIHIKQTLLLDSLQRIGKVVPESILAPLLSTGLHYRNKARLSVRFVNKKQKALVGFREKSNSRYIADIDSCTILHAELGNRLADLKDLIASLDNPHAIAQIELAAGDKEIALIFRNLEILNAADELKLKNFAQRYQFIIFMQPEGPESVYLLYPPNAASFLKYSHVVENINFYFHPNDFMQVNAEINQTMVSQALDLLALKSQDNVLDLFCGLGNFSLPIAKYAHWVTGIEGSDTMVERATMNAALNHIVNCSFLCSNLDQPQILLPYKNQGINKVLLDPPRAGALEIVKSISYISPETIVYVSCNPATLARDSGILVHDHGYRLKAAGVMDMFSHTAHVESMVLFERG